MKTIRKISVPTLMLSLVALLFLSNCKDEDNYNYDKIEPGLVNGISGPQTAKADGFTSYDYSVIHRGGSEYEWSSNNKDLVLKIEKDPKYPNKASIIYEELHDSSKVNITVKETTSGNKTATVKDTIQLLPFCPYSTSKWNGNWSSSNTQDVAETVYADTTDKPNQLRLYGLADFVTSRWGESWVNGDGSCVVRLCCEEEVRIDQQWIGDSNYPDTYKIQGKGTIDKSAQMITLSYDVIYAGGSGYKHINTTLTLK